MLSEHDFIYDGFFDIELAIGGVLDRTFSFPDPPPPSVIHMMPLPTDMQLENASLPPSTTLPYNVRYFERESDWGRPVLPAPMDAAVCMDGFDVTTADADGYGDRFDDYGSDGAGYGSDT